MSKIKKLELTWVGKNEQEEIEPRILVENPELSHIYETAANGQVKMTNDDGTFDNMLIHGDNLLALKALEQDFAGQVKCIYIDPPYNTGSAFEHYDDNLEHSIWLDLMKKRLEILKNLLKPEGTIFIQIDDTEQAYLKVLCDEVFGRNNYINMVSVNAKVSAGASGGGEDKRLKKNIEYILIYTKSFENFVPFKPVYKYTELMNYISKMKEDEKSFKYTSVLYKCEDRTYFKTIQDGAGDDIVIEKVNNYEIKSIKQVAELENISIEQAYNKYYDKVMTTTNAQTSIRTRVWEATDSENNMYIATYVPKTGKDKGKSKELIFMGKQKVLVIWLRDTAEINKGKIYKKEKVGTFWDGFSWINVTKEGSVLFPNGKKPETLIEQILNMATEEGELVLDSFLGSGTTCAVAHKMKRRWIGIELGEHAYTHCKPRLDAVVNGEDLGGITKAVNWQGGGSYRFYELAPSLVVKDKYGKDIINPEYNANMLAAAMAKHEGFKYSPDKENVYKQGFASEKSFIFTTTTHLTAEYLDEIAGHFADDEFLVINCKSFDGNISNNYKNIKIKKIPQSILGKCVFGKDNYNLNIINLPTEEGADEEN